MISYAGSQAPVRMLSAAAEMLMIKHCSSVMYIARLADAFYRPGESMKVEINAK